MSTRSNGGSCLDKRGCTVTRLEMCNDSRYQYYSVHNGFYLFFWSSRLLGCNIVSRTSPSNQRKSPLDTHHSYLVVLNRPVSRSC
jgi:hypothetical protein